MNTLPEQINPQQIAAMRSVLKERERQNKLWGVQNHHPAVWSSLIGEEFGELCQAINETIFQNGPEKEALGGHDNMREEAVQVAALAIQFIEYLDRRLEG